MLKIKKNLNITGISEIEGKQVAFMSAVRSDMLNFEETVNTLVDNLESEGIA